jgi:hypothetical protein
MISVIIYHLYKLSATKVKLIYTIKDVNFQTICQIETKDIKSINCFLTSCLIKIS